MKKDKGFTLVELLAVIVVLAVILVIAIPKVLEIIDNSKNSSWNELTIEALNSVKTNSNIYNASTGTYKYTVQNICNQNKLTEFINTENVTPSCEKKGNNYLFKLTGKIKYEGKEYMFTCDETGNCEGVPEWDLYYYYQAGQRQTDKYSNIVSDYWIQVNSTTGLKEACRYSKDEKKGDVMCVRANSWDCGTVTNNNCANTGGYIASKLTEFRNAGATCTYSGSYFSCSFPISGVSATIAIYNYGRVEAGRGGHACAADGSWVACPY